MERINLHIFNEVLHHLGQVATGVKPERLSGLMSEGGVLSKPRKNILSQEIRTYHSSRFVAKIIRVQECTHVGMTESPLTGLVHYAAPFFKNCLNEPRLIMRKEEEILITKESFKNHFKQRSRHYHRLHSLG